MVRIEVVSFMYTLQIMARCNRKYGIKNITKNAFILKTEEDGHIFATKKTHIHVFLCNIVEFMMRLKI
jgi:hypothetical protein